MALAGYFWIVPSQDIDPQYSSGFARQAQGKSKAREKHHRR
jgi:hypothetical protein